MLSSLRSCAAAARSRDVLGITRARPRYFAFAVVAVLGFLAQPARAEDAPRLLESRESLYNNIYVYAQGSYISMTFGYNRALYTESVYNTLDDRDLPVSYTRFMTAALAYAKNVNSILEIGFGAGRTAWYLHRTLPDVPITSVELDPAVVDLAHKYFGVKEEANFHAVNQDGRAFLIGSKEHYDIILIDAYRGPFVPFHLLTKEFYQLVKDHLSAGGVVAQNVEPSTMLFDSAVKTIHSVFPEVEFYMAGGNVVTVAYDGARRGRDELMRVAAERQRAFHPRYDLTTMLAERREFVPNVGTIDADAKVLTDDFAPVETLKAIETHNRKWPDKGG
jgi:spermidine synthase